MISDPYPQLTVPQLLSFAPQGLEDSSLTQALQVLNQVVAQVNNIINLLNIKAGGSWARQANKWTTNPTFGSLTVTAGITGTTISGTTISGQTLTLTPASDGDKVLLVTNAANNANYLDVNTSTEGVSTAGFFQSNGTGFCGSALYSLTDNSLSQPSLMIQSNGGTDIIQINTNTHNVGINRAPNTAYDLDVNGAVIIRGSTLWLDGSIELTMPGSGSSIQSAGVIKVNSIQNNSGSTLTLTATNITLAGTVSPTHLILPTS